MSLTKRKILVTGAKGFIGGYLAKRLTELEYTIIEFEGDITKDSSYDRIQKEDIYHCYHLAAKSFVPESWNTPDEFIKTNVYGTEKVLEFCRKKSIPLTFVSSYLYGNPKYLPINEKHPLQTPNPYALSKYLGEELCRFYNEYYKMKICVLRPFNTYGPGQNKRFLIPILMDQFLGTVEKVIIKDLTPKRDYVYISDLIEALVLTLGVATAENLLVLNIGSGYSLSVADVIDEIKKQSGTKKEVISLNEVRPNEIPDTVADITLAFEKMGWKPKVSFEEGIKEILKTQVK